MEANTNLKKVFMSKYGVENVYNHAILTNSDHLQRRIFYFCFPMNMLSPVVLMLGGNLDNTPGALTEARLKLSERLGKLVATSGIYLTAPWGMSEQSSFLNQAILIESNLDPESVLQICQKTERELGRENGLPNGPRLIDIDIMFIGSAVLRSEQLQIPHPRLHLRKFNLVPLEAIIPDFIHPVLSKTIREINENCEDDLAVQLLPDN